VSPDDTVALRAACEELIAASETRAAFARLAQDRASQFTVQKMTQAYLQRYRSMMGVETPIIPC